MMTAALLADGVYVCCHCQAPGPRQDERHRHGREILVAFECNACGRWCDVGTPTPVRVGDEAY